MRRMPLPCQPSINVAMSISVGQQVVDNKLTSLLSIQVTAPIWLEVCILYNRSTLSPPVLTKARASGHPFRTCLTPTCGGNSYLHQVPEEDL